MTGHETPDEGSAALIGQNVVMSYFEQNQADALDLNKTVIETIQGASSGQSYNELRALLGQFLFKGDSVEKKVCYLSGGEKARLSLCCMMLTPANLLILDEPTNRELLRSPLVFAPLVCLFSLVSRHSHSCSFHHRFVRLKGVVCSQHELSHLAQVVSPFFLFFFQGYSRQGDVGRSLATFHWFRHDCDS